jgi:hypothetical protein
VLLVEIGIMFDVRCAGRGAAVDKEVDGVERRPKNFLRPCDHEAIANSPATLPG